MTRPSLPSCLFVQPLPVLLHTSATSRLPRSSQPRPVSAPRVSTIRNVAPPPGPPNQSQSPHPSNPDPLDSPSVAPQSSPEVSSVFDEFVQNLDSDIRQSLNNNPAQKPHHARRLSRQEQHRLKLQKDKDKREKRLNILTSLPAELVIEHVEHKCSGCGSPLQSETPKRPGYLPSNILNSSDPEIVPVRELTQQKDTQSDNPSSHICQRCFRLTHYGSIDQELRCFTKNAVKVATKLSTPLEVTGELTPAKFRKCLEQLQSLNAVVVYLVDIFDFHGSFIPGLRDIIGKKNPVLLAVNKVDLLPKDYKPSRVESWIQHECRSMRMFNVEGIHLISSTRGTGVSALLADAVRLARARRANIYVVGAANVGKSSFINQLISRRKFAGGKRAEGRKSSAKKNGILDSSQALTTSVIPGTTLDVVKVPLGPNVSLYDTPGLMISHQLTNLLDENDLRDVVPSKGVEKTTLRLAEGKAIYIGGLARVEIVSGRAFFFTCFFSSSVKVHPSKIEGAKEFTKRHVGGMLTPPSTEEGYERLGEWTNKSFSIEGDGWRRASVDIVLSGLGWISVTGPGKVRIRVCVPGNVGVFTRDPLMPYEVQGGVSRYTGTRAVNRKGKKKGSKPDDGATEGEDGSWMFTEGMEFL